MTAAVATNEPAELRAGLTWQWERNDLADYPASAWTLKYWFKRQGGTDKFSVTASANGSAFSVNVAASTTAAYVADDYTWVAVVTAGSESFEVDRGTLKLLPRYDQDVALDDRTHAKKMLETIEAALEAITKWDVKSYAVGSRQMTKRDVPELLQLRDKYKGEVFREQLAENARNGKEGGKLVVRL